MPEITNNPREWGSLAENDLKSAQEGAWPLILILKKLLCLSSKNKHSIYLGHTRRICYFTNRTQAGNKKLRTSLPTSLLLILVRFLTEVDGVQEEVSRVLMLLTFETYRGGTSFKFGTWSVNFHQTKSPVELMKMATLSPVKTFTTQYPNTVPWPKKESEKYLVSTVHACTQPSMLTWRGRGIWCWSVQVMILFLMLHK